MIRAIGGGSWFVMLSFAASSVTLGQSTAAAVAFDVATIKPSDPTIVRPVDLRVLPGGRLTVTGYTLKLLIHDACGVKYNQMSGGPAWTDSEAFDIAARAGLVEGDPNREQMMRMLQTLLADRFQLKVHREAREGDVFALVVAKNGPKHQVAKSAEESFLRFTRNGPPFDRPAVSFVVTGQKASMPLLAERLNDLGLGRPVLDRTGLSGDFDFKFEYAPDDTQPDSGPSIFTALQGVGLKLEPQRGPVEVLVIDRAVKPSGN